jgi:hypothetical protein
MDAPCHPAITWPGFAAGRALVLPLQAGFMVTPFGERCQIDGVRLARKREFHVTLLDRQMARAAAGYGEAPLRALYESLQWTPQRTGRYVLLHETKRTDTGALECWSLIEHLHLPAMHAFRTALAQALGPAFDDPVPHVTHFVHGDPNGIGVPHVRALGRLRVRAVTA